MRLAWLFAFALVACSHAAGDVGDDAPCTPSSCRTGQYCATDGACTTGCETADQCGDGQGCCDHQCIDTESNADSCGACGNVCGGGTACCAGSCLALDTLADCGACGNACDTGDFCDGQQCNTPTYPNFCANKTVYVIYDNITSDDHAADLMASTITANCPADVVVHTASQTDPTLVDQTTGQPLAGGGVTYVLGGGPFPNHPLAWLEHAQAVTPVYFEAPDGVNFYWRDRAGTTVAQMAGSACSAHADQFITELVTDPASGTLSLIGYGACAGSRGTLAAAFFYANQILPNAASYPDSWYVFGWADTDGDSTPSAGDTYTILAHGI